MNASARQRAAVGEPGRQHVDVADDPALEAAFCKASIVSTTMETPPRQ